ncbi:MAG: acyl-CoA dehydrogenase family protein [Planctomycetota bacterium]
MSIHRVTSPDSPPFAQLESQLKQLVERRIANRVWVDEELRLCAEAGVFEWFHQTEFGGQGWDAEQLTRGYLMLSRVCLTTAFVLTQRTGACQRIEGSPNLRFAETWLPRLIRGEAFATVGISHLTTSRQHLLGPTLRATETGSGFQLNGYTPWVTGAPAADLFVVGAALEDGRQVLLGVPRELPGVEVPKANQLLALQASQTGQVIFKQVEVPASNLLQGPDPNVLQRGRGAGTGGLQTTTLAVGLAFSALEYLNGEVGNRPDLKSVASALEAESIALHQDLLAAATGQATCSNEQLRQRANSLVLRATQAALAVAKGAGYSPDHPVGRWCCEALFFLVWSCPQPVIDANLCELAGLEN